MMDDTFGHRYAYTTTIIDTLKRSLNDRLDAERSTLIGDHTCVYATGSCGRMEMGRGSDLDAYVVRIDGNELSNSKPIEAAVKAANAAARLPSLDGDGKYLEMVKATDVLDLLGEPRDDESGVLTKRMLLLLESRVLIGEGAHSSLIDRVIDIYWRNAEVHPKDYLPIILVNDIVRYWRILLLNHEWKIREKRKRLVEDPQVSSADEKDLLLAERRYRSYKLRLPRCLTCFSALTYMLALTSKEPAHVSKSDIRAMVGLTPIERLRDLPRLAKSKLDQVDELLSIYGSYLERTDTDKRHLVAQLRSDSDFQQEVSRDGRRFTELMFALVQVLGGGRTLHRHMVV